MNVKELKAIKSLLQVITSNQEQEKFIPQDSNGNHEMKNHPTKV